MKKLGLVLVLLFAAIVVMAEPWEWRKPDPPEILMTPPGIPVVTFPRSASSLALAQRPLKLPSLSPGDSCPVSKGNREMVFKDEDYIFCAKCDWFGSGPAYLSLWGGSTNHDAVFKYPNEWTFPAKTPWVASPSYTGSILVRGRRIQGAPQKLRFTHSGSPQSDELDLIADENSRSRPEHWSFWPTGMVLPGPGCFGLQVDTTAGTDVVVFSVTK